MTPVFKIQYDLLEKTFRLKAGSLPKFKSKPTSISVAKRIINFVECLDDFASQFRVFKIICDPHGFQRRLRSFPIDFTM